MSKVTPHLWYDRQAVEAAELYASVFPDSHVIDVSTIHDTPSGDAEVVSFEVVGQPFMAINGGPLFTFTPAISFLVECVSADEVDAIWEKLSEGGAALMPLGAYPFSSRFGWLADRYGLSWQLIDASEGGRRGRRVIPALLFVGDVCGKAEEAISFYASLFPDSGIGDVQRYGESEEPDLAGTVRHAAFTLAGQELAAMDSAHEHDFGFNEAVSLMVGCETQDEIDHYWERLSAVPRGRAVRMAEGPLRRLVADRPVPARRAAPGRNRGAGGEGHAGVPRDEKARPRGAHAGLRRRVSGALRRFNTSLTAPRAFDPPVGYPDSSCALATPERSRRQVAEWDRARVRVRVFR
jgi:predicted 3-demethylubiquinone-9 3-methyltransferase (glyoxalase superfamily)